jgi:hypothetical protein
LSFFRYFYPFVDAITALSDNRISEKAQAEVYIQFCKTDKYYLILVEKIW